MRRTSFRWYLKKTLTEATDTGTLNLKTLTELSKQDEFLRAVLTLYIYAYYDAEQAEQRLNAFALPMDSGKYYHESGIPDANALRAMPDAYHEVYDDYIRYTSEKRTNVRIKAKYRQELLMQMKRQDLSQRSVGKLCEVDFACISRFLQGSDYAISEKRLKSIVETLRGAEKDKMRDARLYIENYSETELAKGMMEISFTLNIEESALNALRQLCSENNITFPVLIEKFLNWLLTDTSYPEQWIQKQPE